MQLDVVQHALAIRCNIAYATRMPAKSTFVMGIVSQPTMCLEVVSKGEIGPPAVIARHPLIQ